MYIVYCILYMYDYVRPLIDTPQIILTMIIDTNNNNTTNINYNNDNTNTNTYNTNTEHY